MLSLGVQGVPVGAQDHTVLWLGLPRRRSSPCASRGVQGAALLMPQLCDGAGSTKDPPSLFFPPLCFLRPPPAPPCLFPHLHIGTQQCRAKNKVKCTQTHKGFSLFCCVTVSMWLLMLS